MSALISNMMVTKLSLNSNMFTRILFLFMLLFTLQGCQSNNGSSAMTKNVLSQYKNWKGTPYQYGGSTKKGIDCSAFTQNFYKTYYSKNLPRMTDAQMVTGRKVKYLKPGDLVFFKTNKRSKVLHVGIYYKNNQFLHAATSTGVTMSSLDNSYWKSHFIQARRII